MEAPNPLDPRLWQEARIYRPKERVRAIRLGDTWHVFDGVSIHEFTDRQFRDNYEIAAQTAYGDEDSKRIEYHANQI